MPLVTPKLEFSTNDLSVSNAAATWTNITQYCKSAAWSSGVTREFDDPQSGTATFVLKNLQRRFEPEYTAGAYYPNIVPGRRFRLTMTADGVNYQQGIWYAQSWEVSYPDRGSTYSEVVVTCSDGFWRLAIKPQTFMSPPQAETYQDVVESDNPYAYWTLGDVTAGRFASVDGPELVTKAGQVPTTLTNPVVGDDGTAVEFVAPTGSYMRGKADDMSVFSDAGGLTVEAVVHVVGSATNSNIAAFGFNAGSAAFNIQFRADRLIYNNGANTLLNSALSADTTYHLAATWDGSVWTYWKNGVAQSSVTFPYGGASDANEYFYVGNGHGFSSAGDIQVSHVAWYTYALPQARLVAHANAAFNGYPAQTIGTRVAALATDSLWSTAGITAGTITAAARFKHGQSTLEEITESTRIGQPGTLFYFNDNGDPANRNLSDTQTVSTTLGDAAGEVPYDSLDGLQMNDEVFNSSTVTADHLAGSTATNNTSISALGTRSQDSDGIYAYQLDTALVAQAIVDRFSVPSYRLDAIQLNGGSGQQARTQILTREVGDTIRIRRRGDGGVPVDIITRILQKQKSIDVHGDLRCTWTLARGFNASLAQWRLAVTGFGELGQTTTLA